MSIARSRPPRRAPCPRPAAGAGAARARSRLDVGHERRAPFHHRQRCGRGAKLAGHADEIARLGAFAGSGLLARTASHAVTDTVTNSAGEGRRRRPRSRSRWPRELVGTEREGEGVVLGEPRRESEKEEGLARRRADRREVRQRSCERAVADLPGRRPAIAEPEVHTLDHRVDRAGAQRAPARTTAASSPIPRIAAARLRGCAARPRSRRSGRRSAMPVDDPGPVQVVRRQLAAHAVAGQDPDAEAPHLACHVP